MRDVAVKGDHNMIGQGCLDTPLGLHLTGQEAECPRSFIKEQLLADADAGNFFRVLAGTELEDAESGEEDEDDLEIWGPSELAFCGGFAKAFLGRLFGFYSLIGHNLAITG